MSLSFTQRRQLTLPTRRAFLFRLAIAPGVVAALAADGGEPPPTRRVRFGLITAVHQDVMPDGLERVRAFVTSMEPARPSFVLQLGDFCCPAPRNQPFLDGNEPGGKSGGYRRFMGAEQLAWLERELAEAARPVVLFVHQPFDADHGGCLENSSSVRAVVEQAEARKPGSVVAVFSGHLHLDYAREVNGIRYLQINSASYWWPENLGAHRETFPPEVHQQHPYLTHVAAYRDPLWALVTLDFERGELVVEGRRTEWIGPDPWERGERTSWPRANLHPGITDRRLSLRRGP